MLIFTVAFFAGSETKALVRTKSGALKRSLSEVEPVKSPRDGIATADPLRQRSKSHRPKNLRAAPSCSTPNRGYTPMVGRSMTHALAFTSQALHWTAHNAIQRHIRKHLPYYTGHISDEKLGAFVELMEHLDGAVAMGQTNSGTPRSAPSHSHPEPQFAAQGVERDGGQPRGFNPAAGNVQGSAGFRQGGQGPMPMPWGTMSPMIYPVVQFPMSVPGMELLHRPPGGASTSQPGAQASQVAATCCYPSACGWKGSNFASLNRCNRSRCTHGLFEMPAWSRLLCCPGCLRCLNEEYPAQQAICQVSSRLFVRILL